jgi:Uma2 family endonuclease
VLTTLHDFVRNGHLGFLLSNDSAVRTQRGPDTVRGADIAFYRTERIPGGAIPNTPYLDVPPDLVVEVLSPGDRWPNVLRKVSEYLEVGVAVVVVVDPDHRSVHVYSADAPVRIVADAEVLTLPDVLPGLEVRVKDLFE